MASPENNSSQPSVESSAMAGSAHGESIADPSTEEFHQGSWQAQCMYCKKWLSARSTGGTKHLSNHLKICPAKCAPIGLKQQKLRMSENAYGSVNLDNKGIFDQELARKNLALMICVHEYPLSIVDHALFQKFCKSLQPLFKMVSRNTIRKEILLMHKAQKERMVKYFANFKYRVAVTSDMWTASHQKKGYMVVTTHFIDESWNLKSFILRFAYVPCPNKDKLDTTYLMINGKHLHMHWCAHVLNLILKDEMSVMEPGFVWLSIWI